MNAITIDEQNKKWIQEYLHGPWTFIYGYENDIKLLEQTNQLTERFAQKELLISAGRDKAKLQKLFESGNININNICDEMQKILSEQEEIKEDTTIVTDKSEIINVIKNKIQERENRKDDCR